MQAEASAAEMARRRQHSDGGSAVPHRQSRLRKLRRLYVLVRHFSCYCVEQSITCTVVSLASFSLKLTCSRHICSRMRPALLNKFSFLGVLLINLSLALLLTHLSVFMQC